MIATKKFQPFKRRVRFLFGIEGAFYGLLVGSALGIVWAILDWKGILYLEWRQLAFLLLGCAALGAVGGCLRRIDDRSVARSIDRRARLKDRLGTTLDQDLGDSVFAGDLISDADQHLSELRPTAVFPVRLRRRHLLAVAGIVLACLLFFLANTRIFLPRQAVAEKEAMTKEAKRLEELRKAIFDDPTDKQSTSPELQALQRDLQKLQKDYEKAHIDPKEAMIKAEELAKKADELAKQSANQSLDKIKQAESMLDKMKQEELKKAGLEMANMSDVNMSDQEFNQKMDSAQQKADGSKGKADQLKQKLDALKAQMNKPGLDEKTKKDLQDQINQAQKDLDQALKDAAQAEKDLESMQLSKEAREALQKVFDDPLWKQIQEKAKKLQQSAQQASKTGQPKLTKEERQQLQKEMEELLKKMMDDDFRKEYLQKLLDAMKDGCST